MLSTVKYFEILSNHNKYAFNSESFTLNWKIFTSETNKNVLLPLLCKLKQNLLCCLLKLIEYSAYEVNAVSRIRLSLFVLPACTDELISHGILLLFYQFYYYLTMHEIYVHQMQYHIHNKHTYQIQHFQSA